MKHPKELGIKIGTPEEAFWTTTLKNTKEAKLQAEREIVMHMHIIKLCYLKIDEEKKKGKT